MKNFFYTFILIFGIIFLFHSQETLADEIITISNAWPKPGLGSALSAVKAYRIEIISNGVRIGEGRCSFIEKFFIEEIKLWANKTCPDAYLGTDYTSESTATVTITAKFNHSGYTAYNGVYYWQVGAYVIELQFGARDEYIYQYKLDGFSVPGNNFSYHTVSNALSNKVYGYVCHYNHYYTLQLPKLQTTWKESTLKDYFLKSNDPLEGIYESTKSDQGMRENKYKLAVKKNPDGGYFLIYLAGANLFNDWTEGELKAYLNSTGTYGLFKARWLTLHKYFDNNYYVNFTQAGFLVSSESNNDELYIKLFPSTSTPKTQESSKWSGSGFALNNGYVVTNYHVIDNATKIKVYHVKNDASRIAYNATVVASDKTNDIAILKINDASFTGFGTIPYKIKSGVCEVGESVWALGFPMTDIMGNEIKFTDGKISARSGIDGKTSVYQISVPIQPGNSGGALFDTKGNLVGITSSGLNRDLQTENVNYAIKVSYLRLLIEDNLSTSILPQGTALQGQTLTTQIKLAKNFVFYIECSK